MSRIFGIDITQIQLSPAEQEARLVVTQRPLRRILAVAGRTIDDVVNCPIAKNQVLGYYKLRNQVERACDISELERWWKLV
jgi:hypothetical protein